MPPRRTANAQSPTADPNLQILATRIEAIASRINEIGGHIQETRHAIGAGVFRAVAWSVGFFLGIIALAGYFGFGSINDQVERTLTVSLNDVRKKAEDATVRIEDMSTRTQDISKIVTTVENTLRTIETGLTRLTDSTLPQVANRLEGAVSRLDLGALQASVAKLQVGFDAIAKDVTRLPQDIRGNLDQLYKEVVAVAAEFRRGTPQGNTAPSGETSPATLHLQLVAAIEDGNLRLMRDCATRLRMFEDTLSPAQAMAIIHAFNILELWTDSMAVVSYQMEKAEAAPVTDESKQMRSRLYGKRALIHNGMGSRDRAKADFDKALDLWKDNEEALNNLGSWYYIEGDYDRCVSMLKDCIRVGSGDMTHQKSNLALALLAWGWKLHPTDASAAREKFKEAVLPAREAYDETPEARRGDDALVLAMTYAALEENGEARMWINKAIELAPHLKTLLKLRDGDPVRAVREMGRGVRDLEAQLPEQQVPR